MVVRVRRIDDPHSRWLVEFDSTESDELLRVGVNGRVVVVQDGYAVPLWDGFSGERMMDDDSSDDDTGWVPDDTT